MKVLKGKQLRRVVEVQVSFDVPDSLARLVKDVTVSFHSQEIAGDSRAVQVPWTDAVRLVGTENSFSVRMNVPIDLPCLLHAIALIDQPGEENHHPVIRRHIGFANISLSGSSDGVQMKISHFESYTLVMPPVPSRRAV